MCCVTYPQTKQHLFLKGDVYSNFTLVEDGAGKTVGFICANIITRVAGWGPGIFVQHVMPPRFNKTIIHHLLFEN
jgi:hypothetical protein